jgi:hypothetical protein
MTRKLKPGDWVFLKNGTFTHVKNVHSHCCDTSHGIFTPAMLKSIAPCSPEHMARITRAAMRYGALVERFAEGTDKRGYLVSFAHERLLAECRAASAKPKKKGKT